MDKGGLFNDVFLQSFSPERLGVSVFLLCRRRGGARAEGISEDRLRVDSAGLRACAQRVVSAGCGVAHGLLAQRHHAFEDGPSAAADNAQSSCPVTLLWLVPFDVGK